MHEHYIAAVATALTDEDITITHHELRATPSLSAVLTLDPHHEDVAFTQLHRLDLHWSIDRGWSLRIEHHPQTGLAPTAVVRGHSVVPVPDVVAAWAWTTMAYPAMTVSRDDLLHQSADVAAITEDLRAYGPDQVVL